MADLMIDNITTPKEEEQLVQLLLGRGYFSKRNYITRIDKIDALEMAGAVLLCNDENHERFPLAFRYWQQALKMRLMSIENCRPIYKTLLKSKKGQLSEWTTLDDIQRIEQQPAQQRKIQSLLVQLRIMSSICWEAVYLDFMHPFMEFLRVELAREGSMSEILDLTWSTLDTILRSEWQHERGLQDSVYKIIFTLFSKFDHLPENSANLNSDNLMKLGDLVLMTDPSHWTDPNIGDRSDFEIYHMTYLYEMMMLLSRFPVELITNEARISFLQLVHRNKYGFHLLHTACFHESSKTLSTIRFIVKLGANLNTGDNDEGNGVLHILAQEPPSETREAKARLLVELGAHLDMANKKGMTAADVWFQKNTPEKRNIADLPDWLRESVPSLQCLNARVIRRHNIPYDDEAILPAVLIPFVSLH